MQVAFDAGIPVIDSLYLGNITITNSLLNRELKKASRKIQTGQRLSVALKNIILIPRMMVFLISIGEQSGRLGEMLTQSVIHIDEKLDKDWSLERAIKAATSVMKNESELRRYLS